MNYLELYRSACISKRFSYRLQRRGFINYFELYRSAYITMRLQHRLQTRSLSRIQSVIDLPTFSISPTKKGFYKLFRALQICLHHHKTLASHTKKEFITPLEIYRPDYISNPFLVSPTKKGIYKLFRALQICLHLQTFLVSPRKKGFYKLFRVLQICLHLQTFLVSPAKKGFYKLFRALQICLHHHKTLASHTKKEFITPLELYRSAYISKPFLLSPTKKGIYKLFRALQICLHHHKTLASLQRRSLSRLQSYIDLPTSSNHFWHRLQRRGFINYLELYRSAYITIRLQHRLQRTSL